MCGRYYFDIDEKELKEIVEAARKNIYGDCNTGEIYPTNNVPIIIERENKISPVIAKWGFPKWNDNGVIINARAESLYEKRMFKNLVNTNRCIIPASGFFEWKRSSSGAKLKEKYFFNNPGSILYMAGLYNTFNEKTEQLSIFDIDQKQLSYVIVTKDANECMDGIHDRMPLIFTKSEMAKWLHGESIDILLEENRAKLIHSVTA